jgi:DUF4097 and DUF4098 domain-containing protein YvlB
VDFYIWLPQGIHEAGLKLVNGSSVVSGVYGDFNAKTVNGKIDFEGGFTSSQFYTVNGGISIYLKDKLGGSIRAKTVNGTVKIEMPRDSSFEVNGATVNGSVRSDFGITIRRGLIGNKASGTVNDGQHEISINTVNGSIRLLKM